MNALDRAGDNIDTVDNQRKVAAQEFLDQLTSGHYRITSTSTNHRTAMHMAKKQTGEMKVALIGWNVRGEQMFKPFFRLLTSILYSWQDEMKQWWIHHKEKVPIFGGDDKAGRGPHWMHPSSPLPPSGLRQETVPRHRAEILDTS